MADLISKQAAIDAVHKDYDAILDFKSDGHTIADSFEDIINALPSTCLRKGKWIYRDGKPATIGKSYSVICSECKEWAEYCTNFCPNCGADMRPQFEEPEINPCRGCEDYDGKGGCKTKGGCAKSRGEEDE